MRVALRRVLRDLDVSVYVAGRVAILRGPSEAMESAIARLHCIMESGGEGCL